MGHTDHVYEKRYGICGQLNKKRFSKKQGGLVSGANDYFFNWLDIVPFVGGRLLAKKLNLMEMECRRWSLTARNSRDRTSSNI